MKMGWVRAGIAAAVIMVLTGAASAQKPGGTLVYLVQPEPPTLAGFISTSGPIGFVAPKIYDGLFDYGPDLEIVPALAESYEISEDGLTVTFNLRQGVVWHDGEPFTSADVQFSVMEVLKQFHPRGPNSFREVVAIDTPDEHTAIFRLERPAPYMMRSLSAYESPMLPKHILENEDVREASIANEPIGTGPFKFVEWRKGQYIRMDKNENYWREGLPYLDRLVARFVADAGTRTAAMESGEVMYAGLGAIPNVDAIRLREEPGFGVTTEGYGMINSMALIEFNTQVEPFDDPAMRQAISNAIGRDFIIKNIFFGYGKPATSALSSNFSATGLYAGPQDNYPPSADPETAIAILDEAGYAPDEDGVRASVTLDLIPYGENWMRSGEYIKQALGDIGIEVELRYEDVPSWLKRIYADYDYQFNLNYFYQLADPVLGVHRHYGTDQIRQGTHFVNATRYSNPKIDELLAAGANEPDAERRAEIYAQIQEILAEDLPVANLFEMQFLTVYNEKLKGHETSGMGPYGSFEQVWIDD